MKMKLRPILIAWWFLLIISDRPFVVKTIGPFKVFTSCDVVKSEIKSVLGSERITLMSTCWQDE